MKTNVLMERKIFASEVKQRSDNKYFSATDLVRAGNRWRASEGLDLFNMSEWLRLKSTKQFKAMLEESEEKKVVISGKGRGKNTWVHPYIFIDMALAINPKLKIKVYKWLYDSLIDYRNESGDSYKKMCGALYINISNKSEYMNIIKKVANRIKVECNVKDWQKANENQLKLRDKIHEYISIFSDIIKDIENLIDISIEKAKSEVKGG